MLAGIMNAKNVGLRELHKYLLTIKFTIRYQHLINKFMRQNLLINKSATRY